jgi:ferritin-like protein
MSEPDRLHESAEDLAPPTRDRHRALRSLMEELEAVDWYSQRVDAAGDDELRAVLAHNRDEEKEHAAMVLEWLRRHDPVLDRFLRQYLFTEKSIVGIEEAAEAEAAGPAAEDGAGAGAAAEEGAADVSSKGSGLGIGSLRDSGRRRPSGS